MAKRKIILYSAVSLDGFIARNDGSYDWLHDEDYAEGKEDYGYERFLENIDTILMGFNTYMDVMSESDIFPYRKTRNFVFTRRKNIPEDPQVTFVSEDIVAFISALKEEEGKDIWLVGGGQINSILTQNRMVDEFILTYIPITLGHGIRLLHGDAFDYRYKLDHSIIYPNGFVQLYLK